MFNAITNCCMKLVLLWVENLCQMSEQGNGVNGVFWRQLHWQLWPSIGKFWFHIYIPGTCTAKRFRASWFRNVRLLCRINDIWLSCRYYALWRADDIRAWLFLIEVSTFAEHNQAFVGYQDGYSARETALCHFRSANRSKKRHVQKHKSIRRLQINQCETLLEFGILFVRWIESGFW